MIEYVKVKHDEECYICHSREDVKTLRVAADSSNAANTIAFCDKCAGTVSRVLNVPMTFERSLDDVEYDELWNQIRLSGE